MSSPNHHHLLLLLLLFFSLSSAATSLDRVPANERFRYVNEGEFGIYINEYDADYRPMFIGTSPFQLMWYNTTPGAYFVALRMATSRSESTRRWVWEANRGRPVGENATLTFGADGNLVLAEADGTVAWSTGTANKGVVGLRVLTNGNIVIYDKKDRFLWQSFDHPTDTILVGQSLPVGRAKTLVSRKSISDGSPGIYSLVAESGGVTLYIETSPKPLPYYNYSDDALSYSETNGSVNFDVNPVSDAAAYELRLNGRILVRPKYNATLSLLRLQPDGNLVVYTYYDPVDYQAWEQTYALFSTNGFWVDECDLTSKCGALGVCDGGMCVACPTPKGSFGWSSSCAPPKNKKGTCKAGAKYYRVAGVENFLSRYTRGEGVAAVGECRRRCDVDCKCLGFLYWEETSQCWLAPVLGSLRKVTNTSHVAYIKSS